MDNRIYRGDGKNIAIAATASSGSLVGAAIRFVLCALDNKKQQQHLLTLTRTAGQITVSAETSSTLEASLVIPGSATVLLDVPRMGRSLVFDIEITPTGGQPKTYQGELLLLPDTRSLERLSGTAISTSATTGALNP